MALGCPLIDRAIDQPPPSDLDGTTVNEMWEVRASWKSDLFIPYLDEEALELIQTHEVVKELVVEDLLY